MNKKEKAGKQKGNNSKRVKSIYEESANPHALQKWNQAENMELFRRERNEKKMLFNQNWRKIQHPNGRRNPPNRVGAGVMNKKFKQKN